MTQQCLCWCCNTQCHPRHVTHQQWLDEIHVSVLGRLFLQESSRFLFFPLLWRFFHRNHDSCSAVTFLEHHQETCLYGAFIESYVGYQFVRQTQSKIQFYGTSQKLYVSTKMSVMKHIFAPLLLWRKEPPMHNQHCRLSIDTMKTLSPGAWTLKSLRRPSNRCTHWHHFIRLCSHIVHVERGMFVT